LCLVYFSLMAGLYGLAFWMPTLIAAAGIKGNFQVGCLSAIPYLVAMVAMVALGRSADARRERRWHVAVPALAGAIGLVGAALTAQDAPVAIGFLSLAAAGVLGAAPNLWSLPTAFLQSTGAAAGIAGINAIGNLAGFASPVIVGYLKDATHDNRSGMFVLAAILSVGAIAVLRLPAKLVNR